MDSVFNLATVADMENAGYAPEQILATLRSRWEAEQRQFDADMDREYEAHERERIAAAVVACNGMPF